MATILLLRIAQPDLPRNSSVRYGFEANDLIVFIRMFRNVQEALRSKLQSDYDAMKTNWTKHALRDITNENKIAEITM